MKPAVEPSHLSVTRLSSSDIPPFVRLWHPDIRRAIEADLPDKYDRRIELSAIFVLPPDSHPSSSDTAQLSNGPRLVVAKRCALCASPKIGQVCSRGHPRCQRCEKRGIECRRLGEGWDILPGSEGSKGTRCKRKWLVEGAADGNEEDTPRKKARKEAAEAVVMRGLAGTCQTRASTRIQKTLELQMKEQSDSKGQGRRTGAVLAGKGKGKAVVRSGVDKAKQKGFIAAGKGKGKRKAVQLGEVDGPEQKKLRVGGKGKGKQKEDIETSVVRLASPCFGSEVAVVAEHLAEGLREATKGTVGTKDQDVTTSVKVKAPKKPRSVGPWRTIKHSPKMGNLRAPPHCVLSTYPRVWASSREEFDNVITSLAKADGNCAVDSHGTHVIMLENSGEFGSHSEDRWDGRTIRLSIARQTVVNGEISTPPAYTPPYKPPPSSFEHRSHSPAFSSSSDDDVMVQPTPSASPIARTDAPDVSLAHIDAQPPHVPSNLNDDIEILSPPASPLNNCENSLHASRLIDHVKPPAELSEASLIEHAYPLEIPLSQVEAQFNAHSEVVDDLITAVSLMNIDMEGDTAPPNSHLPTRSIPSGATCILKASGMFELPGVSAADGPPSPPVDDVIGRLQYPEDDVVSEDIVDRDLCLSSCDTTSEPTENAHSQGLSKIEPSPAPDFAYHRPTPHPPYVLQGFGPIHYPSLPTPPRSTASPSTIRQLALNLGPSTLSPKVEGTDSIVPPDPKVIEPFTEANRLRTPLSVIVSRSSPIVPWVLPDEVAYAWAGLFNVRTIQESIDVLPANTPTTKPNGSILVSSSGRTITKTWRITLEWCPGGEGRLFDRCSPDYEQRLATCERPWWESSRLSPSSTDPAHGLDATMANTYPPVPYPPIASRLNSDAQHGFNATMADTYPPLPYPPLPPRAYAPFMVGPRTFMSYLTEEQMDGSHLLPLALFLPFSREFFPDNHFPSGYFCFECGRVNAQRFLRHRVCESLHCQRRRHLRDQAVGEADTQLASENEKGNVESEEGEGWLWNASSVRDCRLKDWYDKETIRPPKVEEWKDGVKMFSYNLPSLFTDSTGSTANSVSSTPSAPQLVSSVPIASSSAVVIEHGPQQALLRHIFVTHKPSDQEEPSRLFVDIQKKVLLERRPGENVFSASFDFSEAASVAQALETVGKEESELGEKGRQAWPDVIEDVKELMEWRIFSNGEENCEAGLKNMVVQAWHSEGKAKNVFRTSDPTSHIAVLNLGSDTAFSFFLPKHSRPTPNRAGTMPPPNVEESSSAVQKTFAKRQPGQSMAHELVRLSLLHGDVMLLSGKSEYEYSLNRSGMCIVIIAEYHPA